MTISEQDCKRISTAIRAAESKTSGEIVCVLAQTSSDTTALPILIAALIALAMPWLFVALTAMSVHRILSLQAIIFFVLLVLLSLPSVRVALMPRAARRAVAYRVAMEQFAIRGIDINGTAPAFSFLFRLRNATHASSPTRALPPAFRNQSGRTL